jgi:hypothetical protein
LIVFVILCFPALDICVVCGISWLTISAFQTCKESGGSCFDPDVETEDVKKNLDYSLSSIKKALMKSKGDGSISEKKLCPTLFTVRHDTTESCERFSVPPMPYRNGLKKINNNSLYFK